MSDLKDIWSSDAVPDGLSEEQLMAYLEGRLSPEEQHQVELLLDREGMESDALEGLQHLSPAEARQLSGQLNQQLKQTLTKKVRQRRRGIADQKWSWIAVVTVLLLAIVCFLVIYLIKRHH